MAEPFAISGKLDPADWRALASKATACSTTCSTTSSSCGGAPVWQPIPDEVARRFRAPSRPSRAIAGRGARELHARRPALRRRQSASRLHGLGAWRRQRAVGMLAEMLAAGLNANLGGRDHMPIEVERQIVALDAPALRLSRERQRPVRHRHLDGQPHRRAGRARTRALGAEVRRDGRRGERPPARRLRLGRRARLHRAGDGSVRPRQRGAAVDPGERPPSHRPRRARRGDRGGPRAGLTPFLVVGTAGHGRHRRHRRPRRRSPAIARRRSSGFTSTAPSARSRCWRPISRRGSPASSARIRSRFDFHKWGQVPYDAGFILVRDGALHRDDLRRRPPPICGARRAGWPAGSPWPCDFGPDLSRGFRALKTWFTLQGLRHRRARRGDLAHLRAGALSREPHRGDAASWSCWRRSRSTSSASAIAATTPTGSTRRSSPTCRKPAIAAPSTDRDRRPARDPRRHRQSPHRAARHRCHAECGVEIRRRDDGEKPCGLAEGAPGEFHERKHRQSPTNKLSGNADRTAGALQDGLRRYSIWRRCGTGWFIACKAQPNDAAALLDLSTIAQLQGRPQDRRALQAAALKLQRVYRRPAAVGAERPLRLLAFMAPGDFMANTPLEFMLEGSSIVLDMMYVVPGASLPPAAGA